MQRGLIDKYLPRHEFELRLVTGLKRGADFSLWDLGGGVGVFAAAAAQLGINATLVDDFADLEMRGAADAAVETLERLGVTVIRHDFDAGPTPLGEEMDVVTTFHTIEHLHSSPRETYKRIARSLAPGGVFIIAGPNAANLRKRITVPLKGTGWSPMDDWYYQPRFRAHVREPVASDLLTIAEDIGLRPRVLGKNFLGSNRPGLVGKIAQATGPLLERRPSLCSDLYLLASKPPQMAGAALDAPPWGDVL